MAQPSSSHHRDRDIDRSERRSSSRRHHHHRTISSTTLLLVLSLVLAVLAVMLSLPANSNLLNRATGDAAAAVVDPANPQASSWGILTPKRAQALVARESAVAQREADVARREAELLVGAPGGVVQATATPSPCPVCPTIVDMPIQTVIKEVVRDPPTQDVAPAGWYKEAALRMDDILDRELKIADREREIGKREEVVNRREHDASRREAWIMEQLMVLNNEVPPPGNVVEEEYIYETPGKRYPKDLPPPPLILTETQVIAETMTVTQTHHHTHTQTAQKMVTVPPPANTRLAAYPAPEAGHTSPATSHIPKTTSVEIVHEEEIIVEPPTPPEPTTVVTHGRAPIPPPRQPKRWGW